MIIYFISFCAWCLFLAWFVPNLSILKMIFGAAIVTIGMWLPSILTYAVTKKDDKKEED